MEETEQVTAPVAEPVVETTEPSQDPIQAELDKVEKKGEGRTKLEKLEFTKKRIDQQIAEEHKALGIEVTPVPSDDDAPVTVGMLREIEARQSTKTALQMAEEIADPKERELTIHHLENTIRSSGNPAEDLRLAKSIVFSVKNGQIAQEAARGTTPNRAPSAPGAPPLVTEKQPDLTPTEMAFLGKPWNMTKEAIIAART